MKKFKKIFAIVLALVMVMAMAVPAMAVETYDITIQHPRQSADHTYEAYQIFSGVLTTETYTDPTTGLEESEDILTDITWGSGVNGSALLTALTTGTDYPAAVAMFSGATTAAEIAKILSDNNNNAVVIRQFARAAAANLTDVCATSTPDGDNYVIADVAAGYYLIKDQDGSLDDELETYTNIILQVVGDTTMNPKGGSVTVDKDIIDGGIQKDAADYSIGDTVDFEIVGTLPDNYATFTTFEYRIVDTMSPGLTYNNNAVVYLGNAGTKVALDSGYTISTTTNSDNETVITVTFADMKSITGRTIDSHTEIVVNYTATLNENAVIGDAGNPNTVHIEFDNDPYSDSEGKTTEETVYAFTWELDVTKIDGTNHTALAGAEFIVYRELSGANSYAIIANDKVTGWTTTESEATVLTSGADGKFIVSGLEADTYYLKEIAAPAGYNLLTEPVKVDIRASIDPVEESADRVISFEIEVNASGYVPGDQSTGIVNANVINNPGATLPETGGIGTTLFYVFGGIMVLAAVVLLVTKKRMNHN